MEGFAARYERVCAAEGVSPLPAVLRANPPALAIPHTSLTLGACKALAKALIRDASWSALNLADTLLGDEGCMMFCVALKENAMLESLNLSQNNIRFRGMQAIANLLRINSSISELFLEWNSLGSLESSLGELADALSTNTTLRLLDLRNNQINHTAAGQLATALKSNKALSVLDLRWNNLGALGGRALLAALEVNSTLVELRVDGNHIPADIHQAIMARVQRNIQYREAEERDHAKTVFLNSELKSMARASQQKITDLQDFIDRQAEAHDRRCAQDDETLGTLQSHLRTRDVRIEELTLEVHILQQGKRAAETQAKSLAEELATVRLESSLSLKKAQEQCETLSRALEDTHAAQREAHEKHRQELVASQLQLKDRDTTITLKEREIKDLSQQAAVRTRALDQAALDSQSALHQRDALHAQKLRELDAQQTIKEEGLRKEGELQIAHLKEIAQALERRQTQLVKELEGARAEGQGALKDAVAKLEARHSQQLDSHREDQRTRQSDADQLRRSLEGEREALKSQLEQASRALLEAQLKCDSANAEHRSARAELAESRKEREREHGRFQQEIADLKSQLASAQTASKADNARINEAQAQLTSTREELKGTQAVSHEQQRRAEATIAELRALLTAKTDELALLRNNEARRLDELQNSLSRYISGAKASL
eukprot:m.98285 g.98285  ORF g.98285 m.98285 type:complete len:666 (+) comp51393_c0_seq1:27-2024(+)